MHPGRVFAARCSVRAVHAVSADVLVHALPSDDGVIPSPRPHIPELAHNAVRARHSGEGAGCILSSPAPLLPQHPTHTSTASCSIQRKSPLVRLRGTYAHPRDARVSDLLRSE